MLSRQKADPSWLSFIAGALSASLVWSLGWAARRILFPQEPHLRLNRSDDDVSDNESSSSTTGDEDSSLRKSVTRWPWDKLRTSMIKASVSLLNLGIGDESDVSVVTANDKTGLCIGEIFGLDVGGTLTKLVYFEQQIDEYNRQRSHEGLHRREHYTAAASAREVLQARRSESMRNALHNTASDTDLQGLWGLRQESVPDRLDEFASSCNIDTSLSPDREGGETHEQSEKSLGMKRSRSMVNVTKSTEHAEALGNFYSFAKRLDSFDSNFKDKHLSYYSRFLNGTFHFLRFETRRMDHAMNLMRYNNVHLNIKEIGATGESYCGVIPLYYYFLLRIK